MRIFATPLIVAACQQWQPGLEKLALAVCAGDARRHRALLSAESVMTDVKIRRCQARHMITVFFRNIEAASI